MAAAARIGSTELATRYSAGRRGPSEIGVAWLCIGRGEYVGVQRASIVYAVLCTLAESGGGGTRWPVSLVTTALPLVRDSMR
jgi:hypothetical protein